MKIEEVEKLLREIDWEDEIPELECSIIDLYDDSWFYYLLDNYEYFRNDESEEYFFDQDAYCMKYGLPTFVEYLILSGNADAIERFLKNK